MNRERWQEIFQVLESNPGRTFLTAFGIFWGTFIFLALMALTNGLETGVKKGFGNFATNSMFVWTQSTSIPYMGYNKQRRFNFRYQDMEALKESLPELKYVSARNQLGGFGSKANAYRNTAVGSFYVYGDMPTYFIQQPVHILKGRVLNAADIEQKRKIAVIGENVVKILFEGNESVLGQNIFVNSIPFQVVGVVKNANAEGDQDEQANTIYTPLSSFSQVFNFGDVVSWFAITAEDYVSISEVKEKVFKKLRTLHSIHPEDERAMGHFDRAEGFSKISSLFLIFQLVGLVVGVFLLISGMIGVINIMLIVVNERTQEFGIRRAIGATPRTVISQVLLESFILSFFAGIAGIAFGAFALFITRTIVDAQGPFENFAAPILQIEIVGVAFLLLLVVGVLAGIIPAIRAVRMKPVDALRSE